MKLLVYVLGFLFILALSGFFVQSCENRKLERESENTKRLILRNQRMTEKKIDSMVVEQKITEAKNRALTLDRDKAREDLIKERGVTKEWKGKYVQAKNSRLPAMSDIELDSTITAIIGLDR